MTAAVLAGSATAATVLQVTEPLPGFPDYRDYALIAADQEGLVCWLQAIDPDGPRFVAVPAGAYFPEYAPRLPADVLAELSLSAPAEPALYCIVTVPGGDVQAATANLRAPLVVNPATQQARQVVLQDGTHPIRRPLRR